MAAVYPFIREPEGEDPGDMFVEIAEPGMPVTTGGVRITELDDGVEVDFNPGGESMPLDPKGAPFDANLAEYIVEAELSRIGQDVCDAVKVDLESRREWLSRFQKGMELLGVIESKANLGVLKHAREVNHPVIAKALVQYQARAIAEAFPPEGPVKTIVLGKKSTEREEQADRVQGYMNYQLLTEDRAYFHEADQGFFILGLEGSIFKKIYRDELTGKNVSRLVMARDFIVPYSATSLETTPRYTHLLPYSQNDVRKLQATGYYRMCELDIPTGDPAEGHEEAREAQDRMEGKERSDEIEDDREHLVYEQHCELDLPGFEDKDSFDYETGIKLPYVVHVDRDTEKVLAIYRNWREHDALCQKRVRFAHYKYLPGPGFYGLGLVHMIGGLGAAATGILRLLLVTAAFAGAGGGFRTKEGAKLAGSVEIEPGVFKDVTEVGFDELKKAFFQPDFKQPPEALFRVLGLIVEEGESFASAGDTMTGEGPATGPVGTAVTLVEQGSKVFSGIHKRTHMAAGDEYRMLAELNGEHLPPDGYPFEVPGATREVYAEDFDDRIDVVPVSDPNIFSSVQRIAVAQSVYEAAKENPADVNRTVALKRLFNALRVPDVDELFIAHDIPRYDAVSENALILMGKPVRAYQDQDHEAHMAVLASVIQDETIDKTLRAAAAGHYAEHQAMKMMIETAQAMGLPPMPLNLSAGPGEPMAMQLPPHVERAVSQRAAVAINKLKPPQKSPELAKVEGELQLKARRVDGELKIKAEQMRREAALDVAKANHKMALEQRVAFARLKLDRENSIRGMEQDGKLDDAKNAREELRSQGQGVEQAVEKATAELEEAIKQLGAGLQAVMASVEAVAQGQNGGPGATAQPA